MSAHAFTRSRCSHLYIHTSHSLILTHTHTRTHTHTHTQLSLSLSLPHIHARTHARSLSHALIHSLAPSHPKALAQLPYFMTGLKVTSERYQAYRVVAKTPWSLKSLFGSISDLYPIYGYHKSSYVLPRRICAAFHSLSSEERPRVQCMQYGF